MGKTQDFVVRNGKELTGSLVIGRLPDFRLVNASGEFVNEGDPSALEKKLGDLDTAVYILSEKLLVNMAKPQLRGQYFEYSSFFSSGIFNF